MSFEKRLEKRRLGEGRRIKRARDWEMSPDMEADAVKRRSRANREDDTAKGGKSASFYWISAALYPFQNTSSPSQLLHMWHQQQKKKAHFLSMWPCIVYHSLIYMDICWFLALCCSLSTWLLPHHPFWLMMISVLTKWLRCRALPNTNWKLGFPQLQATKFTKMTKCISGP